MRRQSMIQSMNSFEGWGDDTQSVCWRCVRVEGHRVTSRGEDAQQNAGETIAEYALVEETLERC